MEPEGKSQDQADVTVQAKKILRYKLALRGIKVIEESEAWTSKVGRILSKTLGLDVHKVRFALKILAITISRSFAETFPPRWREMNP